MGLTGRVAPVRIGFKTRPVEVDWSTLAATWELADDMVMFESGWLFDHFYTPIPPEGFGSHENMTVAAALAARTRRLRLGHLVLGNTHRHPALLAKMATTIDHIASGRFVLGLGTGWDEAEHAMFGWDLPPIGERLSRLEACIRILRGFWSQESPLSMTGPYSLEDAQLIPRPFTPGGPPLWLGTQGRKRGLRLVAQYADGWNTNAFLDDSYIDEYRASKEALLRHCDEVGRSPGDLEISAQVFVPGRATRAVLEQSLAFANEGVDLIVFIIDSRLGPKELERLSREIAQPLVDAA